MEDHAARRDPREIIEEYRGAWVGSSDRDPREVVETYRAPEQEIREVVETYRAPQKVTAAAAGDGGHTALSAEAPPREDKPSQAESGPRTPRWPPPQSEPQSPQWEAQSVRDSRWPPQAGPQYPQWAPPTPYPQWAPPAPGQWAPPPGSFSPYPPASRRTAPQAGAGGPGVSRNGPGEGGEQPAAKKRRRRGLRIFLLCLAVLVLSAVLAALAARLFTRVINRVLPPRDDYYWSYDDRIPEEDSYENSGEIQIPTWPTGEGPSLTLLRPSRSLTAQEIYRLVNPSVVTVVIDIGDGAGAVGTGVIFSSDGYFITNYHVVEGGLGCRVILESGRMMEALYVAGDEINDLAVLKIRNAEGLPAAEFGDSDLLSVGDKVYAIGNPLGLEFRGTMTDGIVSAIDRDVTIDDHTMNLIQTNAALNSGNSGGPLINEYGQVVGINVIKMMSRRSTIEGLGFAIPSSYMDRLVNDLVRFGEAVPEPTIGITVENYKVELSEGIAGIRVVEVTPGSPADLAGIQPEDYVVSAAGEVITSTRDLLRVRRRLYPGDSLPMLVYRNGTLLAITLEFPG